MLNRTLPAFWLALFVTLAGSSRLQAATTDSSVPAILDDANLHDACFVGANEGWAVGDHGAIWHTSNGARSWDSRPGPFDCTLRSVCFVTDRMGWMAGGGTMPFTRLGVGILLSTKDGGRTWTDLAAGRLPQLHFARFFSETEGVAVGSPTTRFPTGVLNTHDGGKTWEPLDGFWHPGWRAADFIAPDAGIVAGLEGAVARIDERLSNVRTGGFGARGLYGVHLENNNIGWLVGDGALVLRTINRGVVWQAPPNPLPVEASAIFNFRTIAVRGEKLWVAGQPGSVVWHSCDGGNSWERQSTGQTAPIERLIFHSDKSGCAVGAFGSILRTDDGGATWQAVRGANRRAALLAIHSRASGISFNVLAKQSGELGYRSVVVLPLRRADERADIGREFDMRLHDAVVGARGSESCSGWRFPLEIPGIAQNSESLLTEWMRRTEGHFEEAFFGNLVCQIRTWRPTVLLIDRPDDAAGKILNAALLEAVRQAGDPASFTAHHELAGLAPWKVTRLIQRQPPESDGDIVADIHEMLPHLKSIVAAFAASASARLRSIDSDMPEAEAFRIRNLTDSPGETSISAGGARDFFAGLVVGRDARRELPVLKEDLDERTRRMAQRDRVVRSIIKSQTQNGGGSEILATIRSSENGLDNSTAALQLTALADAYRKNAQWDLAEATWIELVERYPSEPAAGDAMRRLLQYWIAEEPTYQRLRIQGVESTHAEFTSSGADQQVRQALALSTIDPSKRGLPEYHEPQKSMNLTNRSGQLNVGNGGLLDLTLRQQRARALRMASRIRRTVPALFQSPEVQLSVSALLRQTGLARLPDDAPGRGGSGGLKAGEPAESLHPFERPNQKAAACKIAAKPPRLDGLLSDSCWQEAKEIPLSESATSLQGDAPHAFVMLAYDANCLYVAASVPRVRTLPTDRPKTLGRKHDEDLTRYDRIALLLDVDRDFASWYTIEIDQRGCVAESCCDDARWNPSLSVAAAGDDERWRIEVAVPLRELVARPPRGGEGWGLALLRTAPAVRLESWSHPASIPPGPDAFGILRFQ